MARIGTIIIAGTLGLGLASTHTPAQETVSSGAQDQESAAERAGELRVGDPAPKLHIAEWVKGEPIERLETGNVYVVEFWATWCPPCRDSIPHLTELQAKYKDDNVHIIGVSSEDGGLGKIEPFVEKMGEQMTYRVAYDNSRRTSAAYMQAAGENGIPTAFIVNRDRRVAWIGHPMVIDDVLDQVVKGTYDVDAAQRSAEREAELMRRAQPLLDRLDQVASQGDMAQAADIAGQIAALDYEFFFNAALWRYQQLVAQERADEASKYLRDLIETHIAEMVQPLNALAWTIATGNPSESDLDLALKAAKRANTLTEGKNPDVLDTLARVHYARGELELAVETQRRAVELAEGPMLEQLRESLESYQQELGG